MPNELLSGDLTPSIIGVPHNKDFKYGRQHVRRSCWKLLK
jgi:hypothetical protein